MRDRVQGLQPGGMYGVSMDEEEPVQQSRAVSLRGVTIALLLVLGCSAMCAGVAWWVHPGAGLAILGLAFFALGVLFGLD